MVTVENGDKAGAWGRNFNIPVMFEKLQVGFDFIIMNNVPLNVVIGCPTLKPWVEVMDFKADVVHLDYCSKKAVVPMVSEIQKSRVSPGVMNSKDFTYDSEKAGI